MGCCEGRDVIVTQKNQGKPLDTLRNLARLTKEALTLNIKPVDKLQLKGFWEKLIYIQEITRERIWRDISITDYCKITRYNDSKYSTDYPVFQILIELEKITPLQSIINGICKVDDRKTWDLHLETLETLGESHENPEIIHSIFKYSYYRPEFFEEKVLVTYYNSVILGFYSTDNVFEYSGDTVRSINYFTIYIIKEKDQKSHLSIFIHINPNTLLALVSKNIIKKKIIDWSESIGKYFNSLK